MKLLMGAEASAVFAFSLSITPAASPASISVNEQAFTVPAGTLPAGGLLSSDFVFVNPPAGFDTTLIAPAYARVNATGQVVIGFANLTAVAHTPTAGVYDFFVVRP